MSRERLFKVELLRNLKQRLFKIMNLSGCQLDALILDMAINAGASKSDYQDQHGYLHLENGRYRYCRDKSQGTYMQVAQAR